MNTILIAGLGLIGGSAGMALRRAGWRVRFLDPHVSLEDAQRAGSADERVETFTGDLILLATPVDVAVDQLRTLDTTAVVTSACSVMRALREVARGTFIAGHPLAGSQERGLGAATADLFEGKPWFVDGDHPLVDELVRDCGAMRERVTAEEHDAGVALTSHLPQVLSTALAAYLHECGEDALRFAGGGLRTFLRLAGSDASVWAPVLEANRDNLAPHAARVAELVRELMDGDARGTFAKAQATWRALAEK
ncbi:MAG TPA: prephenate dehydrogenase/arogenate dehydrogenase family protein [Thermoanaerobaculia bacterium]|nr:prephenate dehydrogenase/arogenate dehydrogenase family protein [Thermoanaerobaculia bacterium]